MININYLLNAYFEMDSFEIISDIVLNQRTFKLK
jgi:hypothetical protein